MTISVRQLTELEPPDAEQDYYDRLCDPDFFGRAAYWLECSQGSIMVAKPGVPVWRTARSASGEPLSPVDLEHLRKEVVLDWADWGISRNSSYLALLIKLDIAYRLGRDKEVFRISEALPVGADTRSIRRVNKIVDATTARYAITHGFWGAPSEMLASPKDDILGEVVSVLTDVCLDRLCAEDWSTDDVVVELPVRKDFVKRGINLSDRLSLLSFYRDTISYVFELSAANHQVETLSNYSRALDCLDGKSGLRMLDYAGGIGTFAILAADRKHFVDFAELDSVTLRYAKERIRRRPWVTDRVRFSTILDDGFVPDGKWDVVVCTELLEHVFEPFALLENLLDRIEANGLLIVSESFNHIEDFCTHLPQHRGLGGAVFVDHMKSIGLLPVLAEPNCHVQVWRKPE
jgi:2-polyprenyl-3-methyl-5-hydroxy-6-metoxy-1,4-benzoquinol methylase